MEPNSSDSDEQRVLEVKRPNAKPLYVNVKTDKQEKVTAANNPRRQRTDGEGFWAWLKARWKNYNIWGFLFNWLPFVPWGFAKKQSDVILQGKSGHGRLILGTIPTTATIDKLYENSGKKLVVVNLLSKGEYSYIKYDEKKVPTIHIPILDHGVISANTGKNISSEELVADLTNIANKIKSGQDVYFHCMAGKSRSFITLMSLLYLHPDLVEGEKYTQDGIEKVLSANPPPSFKEIAAFVKSKRSGVKDFDHLDGDQAGLLGAIALERAATIKDFAADENRDKIAAGIVQDVSMILQMPFDLAYRETDDIQRQKQNFLSVYEEYKKYREKDGENGDLLKQMLLTRSKSKEERLTEGNIKKVFSDLPTAEQARFALLAKQIGDSEREKGVYKLCGCTALELACLAVENNKTPEAKKKLTVGDQVELLRSFGVHCGLKFAEVAENIVSNNASSATARVDRYNAGIQLAELFHVATVEDNKAAAAAVAEKAGSLKHEELFKFAQCINVNKDNSATAALKDVYSKVLTIREQALLLKDFGEGSGISFGNVAKKILAKGLSMKVAGLPYSVGAELAELYTVYAKTGKKISKESAEMFNDALQKVSSDEQTKLQKILSKRSLKIDITEVEEKPAESLDSGKKLMYDSIPGKVISPIIVSDKEKLFLGPSTPPVNDKQNAAIPDAKKPGEVESQKPSM